MARRGRGGRRPRHRGDRLVRRRHARHHRADVRGAGRGRARLRLRPGGLLRAHGARLHLGLVRPRRLAGPRLRVACSSAWPSASWASTPQTGQARLTFGSPELLDGMELVVVAGRPLRVGETIYVASRYGGGDDPAESPGRRLWMTREDWRRSWKPWLRGTLLGFPIGALPAGGSEIPTFLSYVIERRLSPRPRGVRPRGRDRGRGRARGRQQRRGGGRPGPPPHARPADLRDRRDPARRLPELRAPARTVAVPEQPRSRVGAHRVASTSATSCCWC